MNLAGNTALVTGGATGIGLALAEAFLAAGSEVVICGRRESRLLEAQRRRPGLHVRACDVANPEECKALAQWTAENFKNLNLLVNNAGIQRDIDFTQGADELLSGQSEIRINLEAPILLSGLFVPQLIGKPQAAIVNVSSGLGFVPAARMPVYSTTKAAMHAFSMALRHQLKRVGIRVIEIVPPAVDTELNPEGRAQRGNFKAGLDAGTFVAATMKELARGADEIGYGTSAAMLNASRAELDAAFERMNNRW
jgi:uncharacterized oxidoreductase